MPFSSFRFHQPRAVRDTVAGSFYQTRPNAQLALALVLIRSVRLLDQVEGNVPHLICPHSLASSSRLKQKEETDVNKKRRNGGGIQSLIVITAAVREGREEDGKAKGSFWILAESLRQVIMGPCVCCVCGSRTGAVAANRLTITATDDADVAQNGNSKRGQLSSSSSVSNATANSRPAVDPTIG